MDLNEQMEFIEYCSGWVNESDATIRMVEMNAKRSKRLRTNKTAQQIENFISIGTVQLHTIWRLSTADTAWNESKHRIYAKVNKVFSFKSKMHNPSTTRIMEIVCRDDLWLAWYFD